MTSSHKSDNINTFSKLPKAEMICTCVQALEAADTKQTVSLPWQQAVGSVSVEYAYLYPPGYPLVVPGERLSQEAADMLQWYCDMGFDIEGLKKNLYIEVY